MRWKGLLWGSFLEELGYNSLMGLKRRYRSVFVLFFLGWSFALYSGDVIRPIPRHIHYDRAKALLGKRLFFDPKLSADGTVACVSCHDARTGADNRPVSVGIHGRKGGTNAPTVFNSYFNFRQMWNGRARNLHDQASLPIHNPREMGMDKNKIVRYLWSDPTYRKAFQTVYGHSPTFAELTDAISEFEKALYTPDAKFDRFLRGEVSLSPLERKGYHLFKTLGCITCHNGINIGGNSFQKLGLIHPYPHDPHAPDRYAITHDPRDINVYKVPTLRNIALTAPYFHNGKAKTLDEALRQIAYYNLGYRISPEEMHALKAFLQTLTGKHPSILEREKP